MSTTRVPRFMPKLTRPTAHRVPTPGGISKIGPTAPPDRTIATAPAPAAQQGQAETRTSLKTYFTKASNQTEILYNGDRQWARITLRLETAGPVAIGTDQRIVPVNSGLGQLLRTGEEIVRIIPKNSKLYIASTSVNRVSIAVEAVPWLEQITGLLRGLVGRFTK